MKSLNRLALLLPLLAAFPAHAADDAGKVQTLVMMRHGEKPEGGYGQLDCKGFNRSLALAKVLPQRFGKPDQIYAPSTSSQASDPAGTFNYIRPLATIEPTAISQGLPVNTNFETAAIDGLQQQLIDPLHHGKLVFIAWEHKLLQVMATNIMNQYGGKNGGSQVPKWDKNDFDGLFILTVDYSHTPPKAKFRREQQGLDQVSSTCWLP